MSEQLLTIDVQAALRKVSVGRLRGEHQIPLALVRAAAKGGCRGVSISLRKGRLEVKAASSPVDSESISLLHRLLDPGSEDMERHRALEGLEKKGLLDLLVAFAIPSRMVVLQVPEPTNMRLAVRGAVVGVEDMPSDRFSLVVSGCSGPLSAWAKELEQHLRFAPYPVDLNHKRIDGGLQLEDVLVERAFERDGFKGVIGLPRQGLAARTRLVVDGVLVHEVWDSPPGGQIWDATVHCPPYSNAQALALADRLTDGLYRSAAQDLAGLDRHDQARLAQLLFRLADGGLGEPALHGARLFSTVDGTAHSAQEVTGSALGRVLRAIAPGVSAGRYDLDGTVYVLDEHQRGFIERHLNLVVREPRRRPSPRSRMKSGLARWAMAAKRWLRSSFRSLMTSRSLPREQLSLKESAFLRGIESLVEQGLLHGLAQVEPTFINAKLWGWRWFDSPTRPHRLLLGRRNKRVRAMVEEYDRDKASLYPALMYLCDGRDVFGPQRARALSFIAGVDAPEKGD